MNQIDYSAENKGKKMVAKALDKHIEITPGVAGGKPRIAGHRITVQNVVIWHEWLGISADEIVAQCNLSLSDVYAALTYYYDHKEQIDKSIKEDDAFIEQLRKKTPSKIPQKINA